MGESISFIIIIITVLVSLLCWQKPALMDSMTMNPYKINRRNEYWRFITSGFIHADFTHLFFNLFSFFFFGLQLENIFTILYPESGQIIFVVFYVTAIVAADLPTYFKQSKNSHFNSLGASGAVSAVIFAGILFFPTEKIYLFGILGIPGFIYAGLFTWYSIAMDRRGRDYVNHSAHLYGGLYGLVFVTLMYPKVWLTFVEQVKAMLW
ncbi:rhomboid family intramembrane serine protease [Aquirufa ecclesiirivi]|uniref:Rhomboid family intramembrane serine protease n=2 Tax=Aquirufa ecclesiirivi TaxID=2715124 RepID=A0ABT4JG93_9BACT|nr:rhomboid family intramembrane serine protease [Aquirufa ecclesiirivi]MCZ2473523.1 rhomboid family intramembrane serine protease [Aquirufa ecclesiirivi]MCZ2475306.1 rhomboid family intramembrane serine protease [Aquirufa ecclesiirivi]NHC48340.1 rhomboid family intramembrane serine protease [Aquirufa ecclesiirivi]